MPSFLKKLIYGKDLSNPYGNPFHPGHVSTDVPISTGGGYQWYAGGKRVGNVAVGGSSTVHSSLTGHGNLTARPPSPSYLEEARRMAGRDPVTGRRLQPSRPSPTPGPSNPPRQPSHPSHPSPTAGPSNSPQQPSHPSQPSPAGPSNPSQQTPPLPGPSNANPFISDEENARAFRSDVLLRDQLRRREEGEALALARGELGGYFSPVIRPVGRGGRA